MFNFGISEIMVIAVVGLIVIGPERLPRVARTLGHLFGRMQRYVAEIKSDINREVELDELRKLQASMKEAAQDIEESVSKQVNFIEEEVKQAETETRKSVEGAVKEAESSEGSESGAKEKEQQTSAGINLMHALNPPPHTEEASKPEDAESARTAADSQSNADNKERS